MRAFCPHISIAKPSRSSLDDQIRSLTLISHIRLILFQPCNCSSLPPYRLALPQHLLFLNRSRSVEMSASTSVLTPIGEATANIRQCGLGNPVRTRFRGASLPCLLTHFFLDDVGTSLHNAISCVGPDKASKVCSFFM